MKKSLIVYYSMGGNTEYAADKIAEKIGADTLRLEPIKAYKDKGFAKFVWGGRSAMMAEKPKLKDYDVDLTKYDRIVLGFPVWASNITPPLRTFVTENLGKIREMDIAAFACQAGNGAEKAFGKLKKLLGIDAFEAEAIFIDPKSSQSEETDLAIEAFAATLAGEEE